MSETSTEVSKVDIGVQLYARLVSLIHRGIAALDAKDDEAAQKVAAEMVVVVEENRLIHAEQNSNLAYEERALSLGLRIKESMYSTEGIGIDAQAGFERIMRDVETQLRNKFYEGLGGIDAGIPRGWGSRDD